MGIKIRFKRKGTTGAPKAENKIVAGEPFYNTADKTLYVGNSVDGESISDKKHIAEISVNDADGGCSVQIGENANNQLSLPSDVFKKDGANGVSFTLEEIVLDGGGAPVGDK
jgi:hypothetical protein